MAKSIDIRTVFSTVEIVRADSIKPATYNPRKVFENRLSLVELSLSRFGFLLPIYVDCDGEILSGHQRHYIATTRLNAKFVPVVRTRKLNRSESRCINLLFNRATNDMTTVADSESLADVLAKSDIPARVAALPRLDVTSDEFFPIVQAEDIDVVDLLDRNPVWDDVGGVAMSIRMAEIGETSIMPIVVTKQGRQIVNGRARAAAAGKLGQATIRATSIPDAQYEEAAGLLNLLSMKYEVETTLADDLRANAFQAAPLVRHSMSVNSTYELTNYKSPIRYFDPGKKEHAEAWLRHYGPNVLDFGAGNYLDASNMQAMGANAAAFEPYFAWDRQKAWDAAEKWFFSRVIDGREFDSIFLSNVMNTVPFESDRRKVVRIIAALASSRTIVYSTSRHITALAARNIMGSDHNRISLRSNSLRVTGEAGMLVANCAVKPCVQKFHSRSDLAQLWATEFQHVDANESSTHAFVRCSNPRPVDYRALVEALEFEFDLPWEDGERFNRVDRAIEVFEKRLGVDLRQYRKGNDSQT